MPEPLVTFGLLGTGSWQDWDPVTRTHIPHPGKLCPESYEDYILWKYPNGDLPLVAMTGRMKKEVCDSPYVHYFDHTIPSMRGDVAGVFLDAAMTTPYVSGGLAGSTVYLQLTEEGASQIRKTTALSLFHNPLIPGGAPDWELNVLCKVLEVVVAGNNSFARVQLRQDDTFTTTGHNLSHVKRLAITGDINAEFSGWPGGFIYHPRNTLNLTQIFMENFPISGTQMATRMRGLKPEVWAREHALLAQARKKELAIIFSKMSDTIGSNGLPERSMDGILEMQRKAGGIISDFRTASDPGVTYARGPGSWKADGEKWILTQLAKLVAYSSQQRKPKTDWFCLCGTGWLLNLTFLLKDTKLYNITNRDTVYGIRVNTWMSPFGDLFHFYTYPNFSTEPAFNNSCLILDPSDLVYCPLRGRDTTFIRDSNDAVNKVSVGHTFVDGICPGFIGEFTIKYYNAYRGAWLHGAGFDRP